MEDFSRLWRLAVALCRQSIGERFAGSMLGGLWIFIWPMIQLLIYIIIFGKMMGRRLGMDGQVYSYGIYLAAGLLAWTCFANTLSRTSRCLVDRRNIIGKVAVDLRVFPLAINMEEILPYLAGLILLFLVDLFSGWRPEPILLCCMAMAFYCQQVLATGIGLIFCCFAIIGRDVLEMASIGLQMAFWFTPIVYLPSILPDWLQDIIWINPMTVFSEIYQRCFVLGGEIPWALFGYAFAFSHLCLFGGLYLLGSWKKDILDEL